MPAALALVLLSYVARGFSLAPSVLFERRFDMPFAGDAVATIHGGCERCDWGVIGRQGALVRIAIDGRYSQHVMIARGEAPADYRVMLGPLEAGSHRLRITLDAVRSARRIGSTTIASVDIAPVDPASPDALALSMSPILHARPNTISRDTGQRFTDLPILMWYEIVPTPRGRQFRYSVIFTNEDGGTPTDRLMATWGRATDIEYVYGVELDTSGRVLAEEFQGPRHALPPFKGRHEGRHPLLWVATDNNMVKDSGRVRTRYALAPVFADLSTKSRETVMDAHPWTWRLMAAEIAREGKIVPDAGAGAHTIPDLRRFVFVEACTDLENAALSFSVRAGEAGAPTWYDSDRGRPDFRIVRTGCFRGAVPLPKGAGRPDAVRFRAYTKPRKRDDPPAPTGRVRLTRVNAVFTLHDDFTPGPSLFSWTGEQDLAVDGDASMIQFEQSRKGEAQRTPRTQSQ